ncbi:hypothetical protein Tsubulata_034405, partial [Turnera subulata]
SDIDKTITQHTLTSHHHSLGHLKTQILNFQFTPKTKTQKKRNPSGLPKHSTISIHHLIHPFVLVLHPHNSSPSSISLLLKAQTPLEPQIRKEPPKSVVLTSHRRDLDLRLA